MYLPDATLGTNLHGRKTYAFDMPWRLYWRLREITFAVLTAHVGFRKTAEFYDGFLSFKLTRLINVIHYFYNFYCLYEFARHHALKNCLNYIWFSFKFKNKNKKLNLNQKTGDNFKFWDVAFTFIMCLLYSY